jgi:tetratricopeptide (TPR) repeat protein
MNWRQVGLIALAACVVLGAAGYVFISSKVQSFYVDRGVAGPYLAARQAAKNNDAATAGVYYEQALLADPDDVQILQASMQSHLLAGDIEAARKAGLRVLQTEPSHRQALLLSAISAFRESRFDAAIDYLDRMQSGPMTQLLEPNIRLWIALALDDDDEVKRVLAQLGRASSFASVSLSQAARVLESQGEADRAEAFYQRGSRGGGLRYLSFTKAYGAFLERQGKTENAEKLYRFYLSNRPAHPHIVAAEQRLMTGEVPLLNIAPQTGLATAFMAIGEAMMADGRTDLAVAYSQLAFFLDPGDDLAAFQLGVLATRRNDWQSGAFYFEQIAPSAVMFHEAQLQRAQLLNEMGAVESALALLKEQLNRVPEDQSTLMTLGDIYRVHSRFTEAEAAYDRAVENLTNEEANNWHLYFARGIARERNGKWHLAEMDLQTARRLSGDAPLVLNYLGYSWIDRGVFLDEGLKIINQALSKEPQNGAYVDSLGWAYFRLGEFKRALPILERASRLEPTDPVVTSHLGDALWRLGRHFEARYQWRKALAFEPSDEERAAIEKKLLFGLGPVPKPKPEARMPRGGTEI